MAYTDYSGVDMAAGGGLASLLSTIHGLYPQARVTSGYRGPNNPLTQRNPSSMHAMGSPSDPRAVDVAPIPGLKFNDYVSSVKNAGVPIAQAFDEASHPFPWTTGPNWHLASADQPAANTDPAQGPYYNPPSGGSQPMPPQKPMSLGAMMGQQSPVNLSDPAPVNTGAMGTSSLVPQGNSLGAMAQNLPGMPAKAPSKFTAGNIMGVLGDALSAYGGRAPTFAPFMREQQMMGKQQDFEREKFQQELAMRMYAMTHPQDMMDGIAFANAPKEVQNAMVYRENALHPVVADVQRPDGSFIRQTVTRQLPPQVGEVEDGHRYLGGDPANPNSWQAVQ